MARARLESEWTDADGTVHAAGSVVEVDDETLAGLVRDGVATEEPEEKRERGWVGPTLHDGPIAKPQGWVGPTARGEDDAPEEKPERGWVGPTLHDDTPDDAAVRDIDDTDR